MVLKAHGTIMLYLPVLLTVQPVVPISMVCCAVKVPPSIVEGPPAGVMYFSDNTGEVLELRCRATGSPVPELVSSIFSHLHVAVNSQHKVYRTHNIFNVV